MLMQDVEQLKKATLSKHKAEHQEVTIDLEKLRSFWSSQSQA